MVTKDEVKRLITDAVLHAPFTPDNLDVILREPDTEGADAQKTLPLLYIELSETDRSTHHTTDRVGTAIDESTDEGQIVYGIDWEAEVTIEVWTVDGSGESVDALGEQVRRALSTYDSHLSGEPFRDDTGDAVDDITYFALQSGERADDLTQTPTVRRWRETATIYATRYVKTPPAPTITDSDSTVN